MSSLRSFSTSFSFSDDYNVSLPEMRALLKPPYSYSGPPIIIVDVRPPLEMTASASPMLSSDLDEDGSVGGNRAVRLINVLLPDVLSGNWKGDKEAALRDDDDTIYIFTCKAGYRSNLAATFVMQKFGWKNVRNYGGGANEWWSAAK